MADPVKPETKPTKAAPTAEEFAALQADLKTMQSQLTAAVLSGAIRNPVYNPPPKFPKGHAKWTVFVRHSTLPPGLKLMDVEADGPEAAWLKFLDAADTALTHNRLNNEVRLQSNTDQTPQQRFAWVRDQVISAKSWIVKAKLEKPIIVKNERGIEIMMVPSCEAELIGASYAAARDDAMMVKGTVTREQIGFAELVTSR